MSTNPFDSCDEHDPFNSCDEHGHSSKKLVTG
jgi:hypothetical protein